MKRILIVLGVVLLCGVSSVVRAQDASVLEKRQNIRRLLELTKAGEIGSKAIEEQLGSIRQLFTSLPTEMRSKVQAIFEDEMRKEFSPEKIIETVLPVYEKHLSNEDVISLLAFYETPAGQKFAQVLPTIMQEAMQLGEARGKDLSQRIIWRLQAEGVFNRPADNEPSVVVPVTPPKSTKRAPTRRRRP